MEGKLGNATDVHRGIYQHDVFVRDIAKETDQSKD
jgi:hypothetical protein